MDGALRISTGRLAAEVIPFGASLVAVEVPDRDGAVANVVVALDSAEDYRDAGRNAYLGATVGRYANRIAGASFTLDGVEHHLVANEGRNTLHGGPSSWGRRDWVVQERTEASVTLRMDSEAGDGGFPGEVIAIVEYRVEGATLSIVGTVVASEPTVVSLTNHTYWNLAGAEATPGTSPATIDGHRLALEAGEYLVVDDELVPTGQRRPATELLGDGVLGGRVLDHCFVCPWGSATSGWEPTLATRAATLWDPVSGRRMWMRSNQPGLQVYTADKLGIGARRGVALEAQQLPDAPNRPEFPSPVVRPGDGLRGSVRWSVAYVFDTA